MKRKAIIVLPVVLVLAAGFFLTGHFLKSDGAEKYSVEDTRYKCTEYASKTPEEIAASLTLEQKAAQMVMPAVYNIDVSWTNIRMLHFYRMQGYHISTDRTTFTV